MFKVVVKRNQVRKGKEGHFADGGREILWAGTRTGSRWNIPPAGRVFAKEARTGQGTAGCSRGFQSGLIF